MNRALLLNFSLLVIGLCAVKFDEYVINVEGIYEGNVVG